MQGMMQIPYNFYTDTARMARMSSLAHIDKFWISR